MKNFRIVTPGDLIANVPGLFGFYPTDSLILLSFDRQPRSLRLGPVVRVDLGELTNVDAARDVFGFLRPTDRVIAAVIVSRDVCGIDNATDILVELHRCDAWRVLGIWSVARIAAAEAYELEYSALADPPLDDWEVGELPEIVTAQTMRTLSESGELPELSRGEAVAYFKQPVDARVAHAFGEAAAALARRLSEVIRAGGPSAQAALDFLVDQTREAIVAMRDAVGEERIDMRQVQGSDVVAAALCDTFLRDLVVGVLLTEPRATNTLMRALAGILRGAARANALCIFVLSAPAAGRAHRVVGALAAAKEADSGHRLTQLIAGAQAYADADEVARRVREASLQTVESLRVNAG